MNESEGGRGGALRRSAYGDAGTQAESFGLRAGKFVLVAGQLALILTVVRLFNIANEKQLFTALCIIFGGFAVHAWLPFRYRLPFFFLLSFGSLVYVLGWWHEFWDPMVACQRTAWVAGFSAVLIGACYVPVAFRVRVLFVALVGVALAMQRGKYISPHDWDGQFIDVVIWPIVGSMFMFRMIIYLYDIRHAKRPEPIFATLSYFFMVPNIWFPFFPVVDYRTFRRTYYNETASAIYQRGVHWMARGLTHLIAYRYVQYYLLPPADRLLDFQTLTLYMFFSYALYLHISGHFHLIVGILHLFGFNLPRTHHNYFLASSFTDIWRRINIYWKDFMMKVFFFPVFLEVRRWGDRTAIVVATGCVFACTWVLHSYQVFWIEGTFSLNGTVAVLWLAAGVLVAINALLDYQRARNPEAESRKRILVRAMLRPFQTVGMFVLISVFWTSWQRPEYAFSSALKDVRVESLQLSVFWPLVLLLVAALAAAIMQAVRETRPGRRKAEFRPGFGWSFAAGLMPLAVLASVQVPQVRAALGAKNVRVVQDLEQEAFRAENEESMRLVHNYYEDITHAELRYSIFLHMPGAPAYLQPGGLDYPKIIRPVEGLLQSELRPGITAELNGVPLSINKWGMRDSDDITKEKPANTYRIAFLGSSVVMGFGVKDAQVFAKLFEKRLNQEAAEPTPRYQVLNFACGRYNAIQNRIVLEQKVYDFHPDAIYYFAHQGETLSPPRDLADYLNEHRDLLTATGARLPYQCLNEICASLDITSKSHHGPMKSRLQYNGSKIVSCMYGAIINGCREHGILPVWIHIAIPGIVEVPNDAPYSFLLAQNAGFVVLNLAGWAGEHQNDEVKPTPADYHLNALGHQLIAEKLYEAVVSHPQALPPFHPKQ